MSQTVDRVRQFLKKNPVLVAGITGFDKKPNLYKTEICYEEDGVLYFASAKCERFYGELSLSPALVLGAYDPDEGVFLRLRGKVVFLEDASCIERCLKESAALSARWGTDPGMLIAWFLKDAAAEFLYDDGRTEEVPLGTPEHVLVGITVKKDKEIRDRLIRVMERREAEGAKPEDREALLRQKNYDGTLLYLAEKAKEVWPRMNIQPAERSVLFETYDEREQYVALARKRMGNARIEKPEDITYWLGEALG